MKTIVSLVVVVVIAVGGYLGWQYYRSQQMAQSPVKEIASEKIERVGDTWHVAFTSRFDAPVDKVWDAFGQPERVHEYAPENVLKSELVKNERGPAALDTPRARGAREQSRGAARVSVRRRGSGGIGGPQRAERARTARAPG